MREPDELFAALSRSQFRSRFRLNARDAASMRRYGIATVLEHAEAFIRERLAPAAPRRDGRQTPMQGHPAFVAQHATATCCRSCLARWHRIAQGTPLTDEEIAYVLRVLRTWLVRQPEADGHRRQDGLGSGERALRLPFAD